LHYLFVHLRLFSPVFLLFLLLCCVVSWSVLCSSSSMSLNYEYKKKVRVFLQILCRKTKQFCFHLVKIYLCKCVQRVRGRFPVFDWCHKIYLDYWVMDTNSRDGFDFFNQSFELLVKNKSSVFSLLVGKWTTCQLGSSDRFSSIW